MIIKRNIRRLAVCTLEKNWQEKLPLPYVLPVYHAVSDEYLPHLRHIINYKNTKDFEADLDQMSKYVDWLDWNQFKKSLNGEFTTRKKPALLTFDDGLVEFYDVVAPILERKGIFAINFINPKFIDNVDLMFRCKASCLVDELKTVKTGNYSFDKKKILDVNFQNRIILDEWAKELNFDFSEYLKKKRPYLTTIHLQNLSERGFGFASHGWDHPLYHGMELEEQLSNTQKAIDYCKAMNFYHDTFAFPFTDHKVEKRFFELLNQDNKDIITFGTAGLKLDSIKNNLQRIPMEYNKSANEIIREEVAYYRFKSLINKHRIER